MRILLFTIDDQRYGVPAEAIIEIVRAVAITLLPNAPAVIEGMIDLRGSVVPVFDLRRRFRLPPRALSPDDHFVIVRAGARTAALHVDHALDIVDVDDAAIGALTGQVQRADYVAGVAALADGLAVIHDVDTFLSSAESESLDAALAAAATDTTRTS
jgi:purine-binding chemotaxis protein CheW